MPPVRTRTPLYARLYLLIPTYVFKNRRALLFLVYSPIII